MHGFLFIFLAIVSYNVPLDSNVLFIVGFAHLEIVPECEKCMKIHTLCLTCGGHATLHTKLSQNGRTLNTLKQVI